jgi:hypothetical protein
MPFFCSICEVESTLICACCTKDTCANHLCAKCLRCSDCCTCEVVLDEPEAHDVYINVVRKPMLPEPEDDDPDAEQEASAPEHGGSSS